MAHLNIEILDTHTGVRKLVEDDLDWDDLEAADYCYTEGNFGCDCNRALYAHGECADECSEGRYLIKGTVRETGAVLFDELACTA